VISRHPLGTGDEVVAEQGDDRADDREDPAIQPMGSRPGMSSRATAPTIKPKMIQPIMVMGSMILLLERNEPQLKS
jgi:hypothetical protein